MSDQILAGLRQRLAAIPAADRVDAADLAMSSFKALMRDSGGTVDPDPPTFDVRMHGEGVPGHDVSVNDALGLLGPLQNALSAIGQAIARGATGAGKIQEAVKRATELRFTPQLSHGSVIFHLAAPAESVSGHELPGATETDTLADLAMKKLMGVVKLAETTNITTPRLAQDIRVYGPRSAKHLNDLAKAVVDHRIDIDLDWRTPAGVHSSAKLDNRAALGIQSAVTFNRTKVQTVTLTGVLRTVSDIDPVAIVTPDGKVIHMQVIPDIAETLAVLCYRPVVATVQETIVWQLSKGTEKYHRLLLSITAASE